MEVRQPAPLQAPAASAFSPTAGKQGARRRRAVARIHARIADVGMGTFRRQVEDEAAGYERESRIADCWAPTRKTGSACGSLRDKMPLRVREWTCPDGGARHDRDVNAARNIVKSSTAGEAGFEARGAGQNGSGQRSGTRDEARTDAKKSDDADRMDRAASSEGADSKRGSKGNRSAGCPFFECHTIIRAYSKIDESSLFLIQ